MKRILLRAFYLLFFIPLCINAQDVNYLGSLQKKFDSIESLSANFAQYTNGKKNFEGKFLFKKENKFRLELKNITLVSDGETNWNYNKKLDKVIISNYDENDPSAFSLKKLIYDYPAKCAVTELSESGTHVIEFKPKPGSEINAQLIKLWLNNENLVMKVLIKANSGSDLEFRFSNYKINPGLTDSEFSFNPPQGTKVIDIR